MINNEQVYDTKYGDVNGDNILDTVYIIGQRPIDPNIRFIEHIRIAVQDGKTKQLYNINLKTNSGYNPRISLERFSNNNTNQILISMDSLSNGGYGYFYVYSFLNNTPNKIFDYEEFSNRYKYVVNYLQDYKVEVINLTLNKRFIIDIKNKGVNYLKLIYNPDGTLKEPKRGEVLALNDLYPIDINKDGIMEIMASQRVIGLYNKDILGNIETPLKLEGTEFASINNTQYLSTYAPETK